MAIDISSVLLKRLGSDSTPSADPALPDSLKKLTEALRKTIESQNRAAKDQSASEKRAEALNKALLQFDADIKETARVFKNLNATEDQSLKLAERNAKNADAQRKRTDSANARSEGLSAVAKRQSGETQSNILNFIGAIGGKGLQGIVSNFVKASEQTQKDIAQESDARYKDLIESASEKREASTEAADMRAERADAALAEATRTYYENLTKITEDVGNAALGMIEGGALLEAVDKAEAAYKAAQDSRDRINKEGEAMRAAAREESPSSGNGTSQGQSAAISSNLSDIARAIREGTEKNSGLILDAATKDAIQKEKIAKVDSEVAAANNEADVAVSAAGAKLAAARSNAEGKNGSALFKYEGGEAGARWADFRRKGAESSYEGAVAQNASEKKLASIDKANALSEETAAKGEAARLRDSGELVSAKRQKEIGGKNIMNMAVMPPALAVVATAAEKFMELFPVIGQTGNALVELSSALPAAFITLGLKLTTGYLRLATAIKEIWSQPGVSKRYEESDAIAMASPQHKTRGQLFAAAYEARVEKAKRDAEPADDTKWQSSGVKSPVRPIQNAPRSYTPENISGASSGITHAAATHTEAVREAPAREPIRPLPEREQSVGVVPVAASNRNVDEWR